MTTSLVNDVLPSISGLPDSFVREPVVAFANRLCDVVAHTVLPDMPRARPAIVPSGLETVLLI